MFASGNFVEMEQLEIGKIYPTLSVDKEKTKTGCGIILKLQVNYKKDIFIFVPQCYSSRFTDSEIRSINSKYELCYLTSRGPCNCSGSRSVVLEFTSPSDNFEPTFGWFKICRFGQGWSGTSGGFNNYHFGEGSPAHPGFNTCRFGKGDLAHPDVISELGSLL